MKKEELKNNLFNIICWLPVIGALFIINVSLISRQDLDKIFKYYSFRKGSILIYYQAVCLILFWLYIMSTIMKEINQVHS